MRRNALILLFAAALAVPPAASGSAKATLMVRPAGVARGGHLVVSGTGCRAHEVVYLISPAFLGHAFVNHSVGTIARSSGSFSRLVTIWARTRPGRYTVTARCGGGNLGVEAHFTVR